MNHLLTWRDAESGDHELLKAFNCVLPEGRDWRGRPVYSQPWGLQAQCLVRDLRPPASAGGVILLGFDEVGLAAVASADEQNGPEQVLMQVVAIAARLRGGDGQHADELIAALLQRLVQRLDESDGHLGFAFAYVDPRNTSSAAGCRRSGGTNVSTEADGWQQWQWDLEVGAADPDESTTPPTWGSAAIVPGS